MKKTIKSFNHPSNAMKTIKSAEAHSPDNTMNAPPRNVVVVKGDVPDSTNISDDPPSMFFSNGDVSSPIVEDDLSKEIMFKDDNTTIGVIPVLVPTSFDICQKRSTSKSNFHFGLSSSS